jgi:hypothetical protein
MWGGRRRRERVLRVLRDKGFSESLLLWLAQNGATVATFRDFAGQPAGELAKVQAQFAMVQYRSTPRPPTLAVRLAEIRESLREANQEWRDIEDRLRPEEGRR